MADHWSWRDEPAPPGPAVVFDMDGVISDASGRQHHLRRGRRNWDAFFDACDQDEPVDEVARLVTVLEPELSVVLLTARPVRVRDRTVSWLTRHDLRWDLLIMRPDRDHTPARRFKRDAVGDLRAYGFDLRLAFEDDRRNVAMFSAEGVPCVYIHSGYYD